LLFGRTSHDDRSDSLSFFLNRVKYPREVAKVSGRTRDFYENAFNKHSKASWKII